MAKRSFIKSGYNNDEFEMFLIYPEFEKDIPRLEQLANRTKTFMIISVLAAVISIAFPASAMGDFRWVAILLSFMFFGVLIISAYHNAKATYMLKQYDKLFAFLDYVKSKKRINISELTQNLSKKDGFLPTLLEKLIEVGALDYVIDEGLLVKKSLFEKEESSKKETSKKK